LALVVPRHGLKLAASEEFLLGSLVLAGAVMPTYRSLHFALAQPWVANAVLLSVAGSVGWYAYSSRAVKRTALALRVAEDTARRRVASGGVATGAALALLAADAADHGALVAWAALRERRDADRRATARANAEGGAGWDAGWWVAEAGARPEDHPRADGPAGAGAAAETNLPGLWDRGSESDPQGDPGAAGEAVAEKVNDSAADVDGAVVRWLASALARSSESAATPAGDAAAAGGVAAALLGLRVSDHLSALEALGLAVNANADAAGVEAGDLRGVVLGLRAVAAPTTTNTGTASAVSNSS
jgi:hypothetical protein